MERSGGNPICSEQLFHFPFASLGSSIISKQQAQGYSFARLLHKKRRASSNPVLQNSSRALPSLCTSTIHRLSQKAKNAKLKNSRSNLHTPDLILKCLQDQVPLNLITRLKHFNMTKQNARKKKSGKINEARMYMHTYIEINRRDSNKQSSI